MTLSYISVISIVASQFTLYSSDSLKAEKVNSTSPAQLCLWATPDRMGPYLTPVTPSGRVKQ